MFLQNQAYHARSDHSDTSDLFPSYGILVSIFHFSRPLFMNYVVPSIITEARRG
jgi:hypothetical protein